MTSLAMFEHSLNGAEPPPGLSLALEGLWWAHNRDWDRAHGCAQAHEGDPACDWVHAHLHRVEGDPENAGYWYRRAGKPVSVAPLGDEWREIVAALLP